MHKTIFTWFGNLPTFTELRGFHYKIRRYNSAQEHSQETQFPIHPNSLSPIRQEKILYFFLCGCCKVLGILYTHTAALNLKANIYIYIYMSKLVALGIIFLVEFGLGLWQFKPHRPTSTNLHLSLN